MTAESARSQAAANKDLLNYNSHSHRNKEKERSYLPLEGLRYTGMTSKISIPPLTTLKWGLGRAGSWLPLGWPCLPITCSIIGTSRDLAFPLPWRKIMSHSIQTNKQTEKVTFLRTNLWRICDNTDDYFLFSFNLNQCSFKTTVQYMLGNRILRSVRIWSQTLISPIIYQ